MELWLSLVHDNSRHNFILIFQSHNNKYIQVGHSSSSTTAAAAAASSAEVKGFKLPCLKSFHVLHLNTRTGHTGQQ